MTFYENIIKEWVGDKREVHLLSLGQLGNIYETIDGTTNFTASMRNDNKVKVFPDENSHEILQEYLRTEMFEKMFRIKKKHGAFTIVGKLLYAPHEWVDEDGTVTINATKYHKIFLGKNGLIIIEDIAFENEIDEIIKEDILGELKLFFNINKTKGFTCVIKEELIPNDFNDTFTTIQENDIIGSISNLAKNDKSVINNKLIVPNCFVKGYTIETKNNQTIHIENSEWVKVRDEIMHDYIIAEDTYFSLHLLKRSRTLTEDELNDVVEKYKTFLNNNSLPKGVRLSKKETIEKRLMSLCDDFSYIKFYNKLIS